MSECKSLCTSYFQFQQYNTKHIGLTLFIVFLSIEPVQIRNTFFFFLIAYNIIVYKTILLLYFTAACYNKVAKETKEMQDAIEAELGINPVEKEVIVLYKGEKEEFHETWEVFNYITTLIGIL